MRDSIRQSDRDPVSASRRTFLTGSTAAVVGGAVVGSLATSSGVHAAGSGELRLGLVGCGGRGTGAAAQALRADSNSRLVAMADAFDDRLQGSLKSLRSQLGERAEVAREQQFVGFDGYQKVLDSDVDVVLLATPPHFRPMHLKAAIQAGKHVFAEKPVAVDGPGVRSVLETTELAKKKSLSIVSGLNSRYSHRMRDLMRRIHEGAIGDILALHTVRYASGVWVRPREPGMTDMEYQMRNWYYFTWLSGDFNVEQFVHQYDQVSWAMQDEYPVRCYSTGGRQSRTGAEYGHIFDHFSSVFEYEGGQRAFTTTRHQPGCSNESGVIAIGTKGTAEWSGRRMAITGANAWEAPDDRETDSHQLEHDAFFAALRDGRIINNGDYMAKSTMMAIIARMSAYTGRTLTWEEAMASQQDLSPTAYTWDADPPPAEVAIPGVTKFV
jgi:myo-inositol 2-dehydrogenase / D-chiro-inositol 1-dehydrogenase